MLHLSSFTGFSIHFGCLNAFRFKSNKFFNRFNQISSERKVKKHFRHPSLSTLKVLYRTSRINLPRTSFERQIRRPLDVISGHQIGTSPGRSNRIFSERPGDVGEGRTRDVLGTNICRLGKMYLKLDDKKAGKNAMLKDQYASKHKLVPI